MRHTRLCARCGIAEFTVRQPSDPRLFCDSCRKPATAAAKIVQFNEKNGVCDYGRKCTVCKELRPWSDYTKRNGACVDCRYARRQKKAYGITVVSQAEHISRHGTHCPLCSKKFGTGARTATDHSHGTGRVRGLICRLCNTALGHFRDNPEIIKAAIAYLEHWAAVHAAEASGAGNEGRTRTLLS